MKRIKIRRSIIRNPPSRLNYVFLFFNIKPYLFHSGVFVSSQTALSFPYFHQIREIKVPFGAVRPWVFRYKCWLVVILIAHLVVLIVWMVIVLVSLVWYHSISTIFFPSIFKLLNFKSVLNQYILHVI